MKKILFVLDDFFPLTGAPAVRISSFLNEFKEEKIEMVVGVSRKTRYPKSYTAIYRPQEKSFFSFLFFLIKMNFFTLYKVWTENYDAVVVSVPKYELLLIFPILRIFCRNLVLDVRDSFEFVHYESYFSHFFPTKVSLSMSKVARRFVSFFFNLSLERARLVTVANKGIKRGLEKFKHKVFVVSNGVDLDLFTRSTNIPPTESLQLVYVGNFAEKDRFDLLISSLKNVSKKYTLNLIGSGRNKEKVIDMLKSNNIIIKDFGVIEHKELPSVLSRMDLGLIFREDQVKDSIPVCLYEFAAMGIPVLSNSVGLMALFVSQYNIGYVCHSPVEIQALINNFDEHKLRPEILRKVAEKNFSRTDQAKEFARLLRSDLYREKKWKIY
jgi:glycosyltransferase involved in cell wall biosynthesis